MNKAVLVLIGIFLMALACLLGIFVDVNFWAGMLFVVGLGCCVAGTETNKE